MGDKSAANVAIAVLVVFGLLLLLSVAVHELAYIWLGRRQEKRAAQLMLDEISRSRGDDIRVARMLDSIPVTQDCPAAERIA